MGLRSFDYFRKLNTDNETNSKLGGVLTLIAIIVAIVLAANETRLFFQKSVDFQALIDNDNLREINIHLDATISAPCQVLSLDSQDEVGAHRLDIQGSLTKTRVAKNGQIIGQSFGLNIPNYRGSQQELNDVLDAVQAEEKCRFQGFFDVKKQKVPGNFHISYHAQHQLMAKIYNANIEIYRKIRLDHVIHDLHFGDQVGDYRQILRRYPKEFQDFMKPWRIIMKQAEPNYKADYEYHMKAIPARFFDQSIKQHKTFYKFSINEAQMIKSLNEPDGIWFRYQFSPINMVYEFEKKSVYHFIVQLFAILGGVFAIFGLVNQLLQKIV